MPRVSHKKGTDAFPILYIRWNIYILKWHWYLNAILQKHRDTRCYFFLYETFYRYTHVVIIITGREAQTQEMDTWRWREIEYQTLHSFQI